MRAAAAARLAGDATIPRMTDDTLQALDGFRTRALARLRAAGCDLHDEAAVARLALASDFAIDVLERQPALLAALLADATVPLAPPVLLPDAAGDWARQLRRYRQAESTRLVWRDVVDGADVEEILAGSSALAEACLRCALDALEADFARRFGVVRAGDGTPQRLVVFGLASWAAAN